MRWPLRIRHDVPLHLSEGHYEEAKKTLEATCERCGIDSDDVGYFGNVGWPGISDIDAVVIGPPGPLSCAASQFERLRQSSTHLRSMFWHEPVYVLTGATDLTARLHTLSGLPRRLQCRLRPVSDPLDTNGVASNAEDVLHGMWMTFLARVSTRLLRSRAVSLRTLLLVYKNLEHSQSYFEKRLAGASHTSFRAGESLHPSSDAVRAHVAMGTDIERIPAHFRAQYQSACRTFDAWWGTSGPRSGPAYTGPVIGRGRFFLRRGKVTRLWEMMGITAGSTNRTAFELFGRYVRGIVGADPIGEYVRASIQARRAYETAGLSYPFISPFGVGPSRRN